MAYYIQNSKKMVKFKNNTGTVIVLVSILLLYSDLLKAQLYTDTTSVMVYSFLEKDTLNINDSVLVTFEIVNTTDTAITFGFYNMIRIGHNDEVFGGTLGFVDLGPSFVDFTLEARSSIVHKYKILVSDFFYLNDNRFNWTFLSRSPNKRIFAHSNKKALYVK